MQFETVEPILPNLFDVSIYIFQCAWIGLVLKVILFSLFPGIFDPTDEHLKLTICPRHREMYGTRWFINKKSCCAPLEWCSHKNSKPKGDRGITLAQSKELYILSNCLVPVGSREYILLGVIFMFFISFINFFGI